MNNPLSSRSIIVDKIYKEFQNTSYNLHKQKLSIIYNRESHIREFKKQQGHTLKRLTENKRAYQSCQESIAPQIKLQNISLLKRISLIQNRKSTTTLNTHVSNLVMSKVKGNAVNSLNNLHDPSSSLLHPVNNYHYHDTRQELKQISKENKILGMKLKEKQFVKAESKKGIKILFKEHDKDLKRLRKVRNGETLLGLQSNNQKHHNSTQKQSMKSYKSLKSLNKNNNELHSANKQSIKTLTQRSKKSLSQLLSKEKNPEQSQ